MSFLLPADIQKDERHIVFFNVQETSPLKSPQNIKYREIIAPGLTIFY